MQLTCILMLILMMSGAIQDLYSQNKKVVDKNSMKVSWHFNDDRIYFSMSAPTEGWVTIGFNNSTSITNTYLLMGNVINGKTNVVEHYTKSPGNYKPVSSYGVREQARNIEGIQTASNTEIKFSLPVKAISKYQHDLFEGSEYVMLIAYSQEDDFQHHSIMRTSIKVEL